MSNAPIKSPAGKPTAGAADASSPTAGPLPRNRYVVYFAIALLGCALDLATKQSMFNWLGLPAAPFVHPNDPEAIARWRGEPGLPHRWWLFEGRLGIETSVNRGALFGFGEGFWWLFATLSVVALVGIMVWLFAYKAAIDRWLTVALSFVSAGILGNLYDRLGLWDSTGLEPAYRHGVRDWILFVWPESGLTMFNPWPNFNIADSLLVTGAIMLIVHAVVWRGDGDRASGAGSRTASSA
ncbi:MAG TPA: signal peptidase II [Pirellulaceae bacterium]|nr:signal peptidase II [Pirellulaceae bacterium]